MRRVWNGKLNVANKEQKVIFLCEMQGQLSDGRWENTNPHNHWEPWCSLNWDTVQVNPDSIGVTESLCFAQKRNYQFNSKWLLDIVGDRVIFKINLLEALGDKIEEILKTDPDLIPDAGVVPDYEGDYWDSKRAKLKKAGLSNELMAEVKALGSYTRKDLNRDCAALSKALKANAVV